MAGFNSAEYSYSLATGQYVGQNMNNGSGSQLVYFSQQDSVSTINYDGEYVMVKFPFFIDLNSIYFKFPHYLYNCDIGYLMGSSDGGSTFQLIDTISETGTKFTLNYTGLPKYNAIKFIMNKTRGGVMLGITQWQIFGDVYSQD
jgi:hypothetical protein